MDDDVTMPLKKLDSVNPSPSLDVAEPGLDRSVAGRFTAGDL